MVDHVQQLTGPADRELLHRRDPQLLDSRGQPPVDLVDVAEVANYVEQEIDPTLIQVGQVDARSEHPPPFVAALVHDAAADHADLDVGIEQDQVDADLGRPERRPVLGVQVPRVLQLEHCRAARQIAEEYFNSDVVLGGILRRAGL